MAIVGAEPFGGGAIAIEVAEVGGGAAAGRGEGLGGVVEEGKAVEEVDVTDVAVSGREPLTCLVAELIGRVRVEKVAPITLGLVLEGKNGLGRVDAGEVMTVIATCPAS